MQYGLFLKLTTFQICFVVELNSCEKCNYLTTNSKNKFKKINQIGNYLKTRFL